ncbi:putative Ran exchange factor Prp20/Pim1 [Trichoderma austrokoningii]
MATKRMNRDATASASARKIKNRERASDAASNITRNTQDSTASMASPPTNRRKRSLKIANDEQATPLVVSKRAKTGSSKTSRKVEQSTASHPAINKVPTAKLAVLVFGDNECGQLGLGPELVEAPRPTENPFLDVDNPSALHIVQLACGGLHVVALTADNKIVTWGVNDESALGRDSHWDGDGDGDEDLNPLESTPTAIPTDCFPPATRFVQVAAGDNCSFALTDTGLVYGWGTFRNPQGDSGFRYDHRGELVKNQTRPIHISSLRQITQICCGANHALALDMAGNIWAWGCNEQYQFGRRLLGRDSGPLTPHQVRVCRNKAKYIACGSFHSFAVDRDDNVWAWGANSFGEAGDAKTAGGDSAFVPPTKIRSLCQKNVLVMDGGAHHSAAVTANGQCLVWGKIDYGQLGIAFTPEQIQDSTLIRCNDRNEPRICLRPTMVPTVQKVVHVACGSDHTLLVDQAGDAYATGYGDQGQLGFNSSDDVAVVRRITGRNLQNRRFTWAGANGNFSTVAGPARMAGHEVRMG